MWLSLTLRLVVAVPYKSLICQDSPESASVAGGGVVPACCPPGSVFGVSRRGSVVPADDDLLPCAGQWQGLASAVTASRSARDSGRQGCTVSVVSARRQIPAISPPRRRPPGPDARGPQRATAVSIGDQQVAVGSLEEEVGVAAGKEPCGCRWPGRGAEGCLVLRKDPCVAEPVCTSVSDVRSASNAAMPCRRPIPAHQPKASGVAGP